MVRREITGIQVLEELGRRGKRYSHLAYCDHQMLKVADSPEKLQDYFNTAKFPIIVAADSDVSIIVSAMEKEWHRRQRRVIARALTSLVAEELLDGFSD